MDYYAFKSIVGSRKQPISLGNSSESFFELGKRPEPYIEPDFVKEEFPKEKPAILLVSAVGASGKSTTARALSHDIGLPILDLAKHKPVGDNTLTGVLTSAYPIETVGSVLEGLRAGTHGIIIDGIDEGRSKTNLQGFEAFLDDLIERSRGAASTSIVILGRSQVLLSTWLYLADQGADVAIVRIDPFKLEHAKNYIDAYVPNRNPAQENMYFEARDRLLDRLGAAFTPSHDSEKAFLSFIGYPPVLDAIATLLREEQNYHKVSQALGDNAEPGLEITLLLKIADFLLDRDRSEKALPNFIEEIASQTDPTLGHQLRQNLYSRDEQCARILARVLGQQFPVQSVPDSTLNDQYERALETWLPEHPFLDGTKIRNAVFEAAVVARCAVSNTEVYREVAFQYVSHARPTYHLLYIMSELAKDLEIEVRLFNMLVQSATDFVGSNDELTVDIEGVAWDEAELPERSTAVLELGVTFAEQDEPREFRFHGFVSRTDTVPLGPFLHNVNVVLPCNLDLVGEPRLESAGACRICAKDVRISTADLVVLSAAGGKSSVHEAGLYLDAANVSGHAAAVSNKGGAIEICCVSHEVGYPLAKYVKQREIPPVDPGLMEKYLRLRRIMLEFRSHKKGGLAKYRVKIEHERVVKNDLGRAVLQRLITQGVLTRDTKFYYVDSSQISEVLGVTWPQLRQHQITPELEGFLRGV